MKKIHFIGIGGISMSALAAILQAQGFSISGSDLVESEQTQMLEALGIKVYIGHRKSNSMHADAIVINGAIAKDNPELSNNIPIISREQLLAKIESKYRIRIAVAGAHGKSTTTAMIAAILIEAGLDPTVHNGALMNIGGKKSNYIIGKGDIFLTEACEFKRSFLTLQPTIAVITNIDYDHVDCYKDLDDLKDAFAQFASKAQIVIRTENCLPISFALSIPGEHNRDNAKAAAAVGRMLGVNDFVIRTALENFKSTDRRFQKLCKINNCDIISDYAHHPAEIAATIQTAKSLYSRFLIIFQPHTYTRTAVLFSGFVNILSSCKSVLYKTYAAREKPIFGGCAKDLAAAIPAKYIATPSALNNFIQKTSGKYDAIILTGAGDMQGLFKA